MSAKHLDEWTFLVGAGASLGSGLPSGDNFSRRVFDLLLRTGPTKLGSRTIDHLRNIVTQQLRLEIFLEILTSEIPPSTVFKPFELLLSAESNFNHLAIVALSPHAIVTTNQDLLLEKAARLLADHRQIIHLHGQCDDLATIITIVSQYLGGLDRRVRRPFQNEIAGRNVVVLGYSGRDRDVMQSLIDAKPQSVKWLLHTDSVIHPELEHAQQVLGRRLEIISTNTRSWLREHLSQEALVKIEALGIKDAPLSPKMPLSVCAAFRGISPLQRNRAVGRLFEHLGKYREAKRIYQQLRPLRDSDKARRLFDLGRVTARVVGQRAGRKIFLKLGNRSDLPPDIRGHALLNAADTSRNMSSPKEANHQLAKLDQLLRNEKSALTYQAYWKLRGWSLIARAGISRLEGRASTAAKFYGRAKHAFLRARDMDGHIAVLTWTAECELTLGEFERGLSLVEEAIREASAYAKSLVSGWPLYVKAEYLTLRGRCADALVILRKAKHILEANGNIQGSLWSLMLQAHCLRETSRQQAEKIFRLLRKRLIGRDLAHIQSRLYLEEAEIARERWNWPGVEASLSALRTHLQHKSKFTKPPRLVLAHALLVEAECARQRHCGEAIALLRHARDAYARMGAKAFVARANVAIGLTDHSDIRMSTLLALCRRSSYDREVDRLTTMDTGFYPIQFV